LNHRTILVTGGAGFIGSNIVAELAADRSTSVVVCDRLRGADTGKWRNLAKHPIADFVPPEKLWEWLNERPGEIEAVVHMGAISSTTEPDADKIVETNFGLSRDLFLWCAEHKRAFIYASSAATYGDGALGFDDDNAFEPLAALRPLNAYGWSKALFDLFAVREAARGAAPPRWAGLKFFNVYGPNEGHKGAMASMVARMWPDVAAGKAVRLFRSDNSEIGDGDQRRDFVHVRDIGEVVRWLAEGRRENGIYNLGSGQARSFNDLATAVFKAAGRPASIDYIDMPEAIRGRYQDFTEAKMGRLRRAGYDRPFTALEAGVEDYVRGYLAKGDPYR
jgi:ADP-L-glycero-D-manno-heptose 6-epimerase